MRQKMVKRMVQVLYTTAIQVAVLFLAAGTFKWGWGWGFIGAYLAGILVNAVLLYRANPAVIAERADNKDAKGWDLLWGGLAFGMITLGIPIVSGLDLRWGWTELATGIHIGGLVLFLIGSVLFAWAMAFNAKFATVVRVGDEDSHPVATNGPYRIVRHPGYLGAVMQSVGTPLILGSWWALIAGGLAIVFLIVRTALEDKTLQEELPGYEKLVSQTRFRLFPGVW
jgi:protein-S-isoprenylcysteine O-methyltransferase Ste14